MTEVKYTLHIQDTPKGPVVSLCFMDGEKIQWLLRNQPPLSAWKPGYSTTHNGSFRIVDAE